MNVFNSKFSLSTTFLSEKTKNKSEKIIIYVAIASFIIHLLAIAYVNSWLFSGREIPDLLKNPLASIYTPFSFILLYEAYLLVYYLPKSTTLYIGKQYEIITLIIIRRIFKDFNNVELSLNWFSNENNIIFTFDLIAVIILFYLIYLFYKMVNVNHKSVITSEIRTFIKFKTITATILVPLFILLAVYNLGGWTYENLISTGHEALSIKNVNKIFFEEFFTVLILIDVLLLLFSLLYIDKFSQVIRNSGFIVSTILIKLTFTIDGVLNPIITITAVLFGVLILYICNKYDKIENRQLSN